MNSTETYWLLNDLLLGCENHQTMDGKDTSYVSEQVAIYDVMELYRADRHDNCTDDRP